MIVFDDFGARLIITVFGGKSWQPQTIERIIRVLSTSTKPFIAVTDEGTAVIKYIGNPAGVEALVSITQQDIFTVDLAGASVIAVYLLPTQLEALIPQLKKLKPGSRIVSHQFKIPGITPSKTIDLKSRADGRMHKIYLWTTPLQAIKEQ